MNTTAQLTEGLRGPFEHPIRGIVSLVDDLLRLCPEQGLRLDWQADRCRISYVTGNSEEATDVPLRKSVFRAILARIAVLCNERIPNSVSPYGGQGELSVGTNPPAKFRVAFTNTPSEQKLELRTETEPASEGNGMIDREAGKGWSIAEGTRSIATLQPEQTEAPRKGSD